MKKYISIILLLSFVLSSCWWVIEEQKIIEDSKYVTTENLKERPFNEELKLIWKVTSSKEVNISAQISWTIAWVNYKSGDKVFAWDILAFLDTKANMTDINYENAIKAYNNTSSIYDLSQASISKDLDSARLQYENAIINRDNIYKTTEKQLELARNQKEQAITWKNNTTNIVWSTLTLQEKALENAKLNLENFKISSTETLKNLDTKKVFLYTNISSSITQALSSVNNSLLFIDPILWVTDKNKDKNDSYDYFLWATSSNYKTEAKTDFLKLYYSYNDLQKIWKENLWEKQKIEYLQKTIKLVNETIELHNNMTNVFENSVISVTSLSDSMLTGFKTSNNTFKSSIFSIKSWLLSLDSNLSDLENIISSTKINNTNQMSALEQAVLIAEANYNNTKTGTNSNQDNALFGEKSASISLDSTMENIESQRSLADNNIIIAEKQLASTRAKYESQLFGTKTQLDTVSWQVKLANQSLENSIIRAPFSWVIISKNIESWSFVSPWMQTFVLSDIKSKIIKMDVSIENAKYLQVWKAVSIQKTDKTYSWSIFMISAWADPITKMYKVEINFDKTQDLSTLNLWDFLDVYIIKESTKQLYLIIPFSSLIVNASKENFVFVVWSGSLVEQRKITIWDSNNREIIVSSWLKIGDKIIVNWALWLSIWDKIKEN